MGIQPHQQCIPRRRLPAPIGRVKRRTNATENNVLAVFGLDKRVTEVALRDTFGHYGCNECKIIINKRTKMPRGYAFVYFSKVEDAIRARENTNGMFLLSQPMRVDFSIGERDFSKNSLPACFPSSSSASYQGHGHQPHSTDMLYSPRSHRGSTTRYYDDGDDRNLRRSHHHHHHHSGASRISSSYGDMKIKQQQQSTNTTTNNNVHFVDSKLTPIYSNSNALKLPSQQQQQHNSNDRFIYQQPVPPLCSMQSDGGGARLSKSSARHGADACFSAPRPFGGCAYSPPQLQHNRHSTSMEDGHDDMFEVTLLQRLLELHRRRPNVRHDVG